MWGVDGTFRVVEILIGDPPADGKVRDLVFGPVNGSLGLFAGLDDLFFSTATFASCPTAVPEALITCKALNPGSCMTNAVSRTRRSATNHDLRLLPEAHPGRFRAAGAARRLRVCALPPGRQRTRSFHAPSPLFRRRQRRADLRSGSSARLFAWRGQFPIHRRRQPQRRAVRDRPG